MFTRYFKQNLDEIKALKINFANLRKCEVNVDCYRACFDYCIPKIKK